MKTATRPEELSSRAHGKDSTSTTEAPIKIARLLAGASVNRFEAERLGEHCLQSTVAVLANHHALGQSEKAPNRFGKPRLVTRYSLPASKHDTSVGVLNTLEDLPLIDMDTWHATRAEFDSLADRCRALLAGPPAAIASDTVEG